MGVSLILTRFLAPLPSRVPASSGNAAEGVAPPRGRDRDVLKPLAVPRTRTGPPASSQPPHSARQRRPGSETFGKKQPAALEHGEGSNEELREKNKQTNKQTRAHNFHVIILDLHRITVGPPGDVEQDASRVRPLPEETREHGAERDGQLIDVALEKEGGGADGRTDKWGQFVHKMVMKEAKRVNYRL